MKALTWDDVVLIPQFSNLASRSEADTSVRLGNLRLKTPIISANMDTITESKMAIAMWNAGGVGALHRFMPVDQMIQEYLAVKRAGADCFISLGVNNWVEPYEKFLNLEASHFIVDVAHGHCEKMYAALTGMNTYRLHNTFIMAGNVATAPAVADLESWGANAIKVGIGGGSVCTTRVVTGHGYPMYSSVKECVDAARVPIIADGGFKSSGDIVKALALGATGVMLGNLLAGTEEAPGETKMGFKTYRGSASADAKAADPYSFSEAAPEGIAIYKTRGKICKQVEILTKGIQSGMSYSGARNLGELFFKAQFVKQTNAGWREGTAHGRN